MKKHIALTITLITAGAMLLLGAATLVATNRSNFGVVPQALYALVLMLYGGFFSKLKKQKWLHFVMVGGSAVLIVFSAGLAICGSNDNARYDESAVIVLGSGVRGDELTPNSEKRLDKAVEYYSRNPDAVFIVSGGKGAGESVTEASAMERYLVEKGLPAEQIVKEENSTSTYENFGNSYEIINRFSPDGSVVFITSRFHVYRAERLARLHGLEPRHVGAGIVWYTVPMNYMREMLAVAKTWVFGK